MESGYMSLCNNFGNQDDRIQQKKKKRNQDDRVHFSFQGGAFI